MNTDKTSYFDLYDSVFAKINRDYELCQMSKSDAFETISDYLRPAVAMFSACNQDLTDRSDDTAEFGYRLSDKNFEILSNYMVICYLDATYIRTPEALKAHMSNTDFHKYDNKDVLGKAKEVRQMYKNENDQYMINYSHQTSAIFDKVIERNRKNRGVVR